MEEKTAQKDQKKVTDLNKAEELMHDFKGGKKEKVLTPKLLITLLIVAVLGVGTGYMLSVSGSDSKLSGVKNLTGGGPQSGRIFGVESTEDLDNPAEGILKEGGIDGEGQYHLEREGGTSQYVYMTSANVDLSQFLNKKIRVWGKTQTAKKAGWLLDVMRVEVL
jgi:hypothetical protein